MGWPQAQEYNEAIQNPRTCFLDTDLREGMVATDKRGLPTSISGAFANVYQVTTPTGKWAIRCLIREVVDRQTRYREISRTLDALQLPYTAPFEFQPHGIRIGSQAYPIVKMQWMTGELLGEYVARHVYDAALMGQLAEKWVVLIKNLQTHNLAHGDLQHGNVLVVNHELKLIDYDGMFVPTFQGMRSNEVGHPNFQHPLRNETDFGPYIDNFSAWVIYVSLRILADAPDLYSLSRGLGRDECLLFNRDDFTHPAASPIFNQIRAHRDNSIIKLGQQIAELLTQLPKDVPSLDPSPFPQIPITRVTAPSDWWRDHIEPSKEEEEQKPTKAIPVVMAEIPPQPRAQREMLVLLIVSCIGFLAGRFDWIGYVGYIGVQAAVILLGVNRLRGYFDQCPPMAARKRHEQEVHLKHEETGEKRIRLDQYRTKITENDEREKSLSSQLQSAISERTVRLGLEIKQAYTDHTVARTSWAKRKQVLAAEEEQALRVTSERFGNEIRGVQNQLDMLSTKREELIQSTLERIRTTSLNNLLSKHTIEGAKLGGIGAQFKINLQCAGILTAAHITYGKVRTVTGIGHTRATALVQWRRNLEMFYESQLPVKLSATDLQLMEQQINARRAQLEDSFRTMQANFTEARNNVTKSFDHRRTELAGEKTKLDAIATNKVAAFNATHTAQIAILQNEFQQQQRILAKETADARISINCIEAEIRRLKIWHREEGQPRTLAYKSLTYGRFLWAVFCSKFNS